MTRLREGSGEQTWSEYLAGFHRDRAGITAATLGCSASDGVDPYRWLLEPLAATGPLLDLACGSGPLYGHHPGGWVGVDRSDAELRLACEGGARRAVRAAADRLPFAQGAVSGVACSMALMILQPLPAVLAEIARVLDRSGVAVLLVPGTWPLTARDVARYGRLMVPLRRTHLGYPNDGRLRHLAGPAGRAGLRIVDDRRRRFALPIPDGATGRLFVRSLYLPGVPARRVAEAEELAAGWAGSDIGIPLRRITLRPAARPRCRASAGPALDRPPHSTTGPAPSP